MKLTDIIAGYTALKYLNTPVKYESYKEKQQAISTALTRRLFGRAIPDSRFIIRGEEVTFIATLSDAVFAFTFPILIMALEVPQAFEELKQVLKSFLRFAFLRKQWKGAKRY